MSTEDPESNQQTRKKSHPGARKLTKGSKMTMEMKADIEKHAEVLEALKDIPSKVDEIFNLLRGPSLSSGNDPSAPDSDVNEPPLDPIDKLVNKVNEVEQPDGLDEDSPDLIHILKLSQPPTEYGEDLQKDVAESINDLYSGEANRSMTEKLREYYKIPGNCKALGVPKVNQEIWPLLPSRVRQRDYNLQQNQQFISVAAVGLARMSEVLFTTTDKIGSELRAKLLKMSMEATTALSYAADEINKRRKLEIKPSLNNEFAGICTAKSAEGYLFGANLPDQLKISKSTAQIMKSSVVKPSFQRTPYHPYRRDSTNLNYPGPSLRMRGAGNRGFQSRPYRQFSRGRFPRPNQPFRNPK